MDWKKNLNSMLGSAVRKAEEIQTAEEDNQQQINKFFSLVIEAFNEIKVEIEKTGRRVTVNRGEYACAIDIFVGSRMEFTYAVKVCKYMPTLKGGYNFYNANRFAPLDSVQRYSFAKIAQIDEQRVIRDFVRAYKKQLDTIAAEKL